MPESAIINPHPEGMSEDQAAAALTELLEGDLEETQETSDEVETDQDIGDDETEEQDPEAEDEEESEDDSEDEDDDSEEDEEGEVDGFEVDGEFISVEEIKDAKASGLRQADYTRKTQELAEERKAVTGQSQQLTTQLTEYQTQIETLQQVIATQMQLDGQTDDNLQRLKQEDFDEYLRVKDSADERRQVFQQLFQHQATAKQQQDQLAAQANQEKQAESFKFLTEKIPAYGDDTERTALQADLTSLLTAEEFGLTKEELDGIDNPKLFLVANALLEARKDDPAKVTKAVAKKKMKKGVSPVVKSGTTKSKTQRRSTQSKKLVQKAASSGDFYDSVDALTALLGGDG